MSRVILAPEWGTGPAAPVAAPGRVDVWWLAPVSDAASVRAAHALLAPDERARASRLRVGGARFALSRAALRRLLGRYLALPPGCVRLVAQRHGKPALDASHGSRLCFNLAHAEEHLLVAVRLDEEVGVDLERVRTGVDTAAVELAVLGPGEPAALFGPVAGGRGAFFGAWVRREALGKAVGVGIAAPVTGAQARAITVRELGGIEGYAAAVASRGTDWTVARLRDATP